MARLRAEARAQTQGQRALRFSRLGQHLAEGRVASRNEATGQDVTVALARIFEDGSGIFNFKRGQEDITIRWTEENNPIFELHADFGGVEGILVATTEPVEVPEANDGN